MVICIEPMITAGDYRLRKSDDGYGYATRDNSLSAHFEHTIVVTKNGFKVLTK
jgi:methionyl aminopeptidase